MFKDDKKQNTTTLWNNGSRVQFSVPPKTPRNLRKCALCKIRTRWSNRNHMFHPIKTSRCNTMNTEMMDMNKIDVIKPTPKGHVSALAKLFHTADRMPHTLLPYIQIGQVRTRTETKLKSRSP